MPGEREQLNSEIRRAGQTMARQMGLDEVPMSDPDYDFFEHGVKYNKFAYHLKGANLYDTTSDVIQVMLFSEQTGAKGPLYDYPKFVKTHPGATFDQYFIVTFKQKAMNEYYKRRGWSEGRKVKHVSILPGRAEEGAGGGVSEQFLGMKGETPSSRMEGEDYKRLVNQIVPGLLRNERNGDVLLVYYWLRRRGKTLQEVADHLNMLALKKGDKWYPKGGFEWHTGTVHRLEKLIGNIVQNYMQREKLGPEDVVSSRIERAVFQVRQN